MIADIDEVLKKLLAQEIAVQGNDIDIRFEQPTREWSARLSKPTINLFLFDIRENWMLRTAEAYRTIKRADGTVEIRRNPVRIDLRYLVTAWVKEPEDEHLLLSAALMAFLRHPFLPEDILPEVLSNQPAPIPLLVASYPETRGPWDKFSELWGVLDNELRPALLLTATVAMDPYRPMVVSQVRTRELRFLQHNGSEDGDKAEIPHLSKTYWSIAGYVTSEKHALPTLVVRLPEKDLTCPVEEDGRFAFSALETGTYTLDILFNSKVIKRDKIQVPSPNYDVDV